VNMAIAPMLARADWSETFWEREVSRPPTVYYPLILLITGGQFIHTHITVGSHSVARHCHVT
jgi:hypothetical protein